MKVTGKSERTWFLASPGTPTFSYHCRDRALGFWGHFHKWVFFLVELPLAVYSTFLHLHRHVLATLLWFTIAIQIKHRESPSHSVFLNLTQSNWSIIQFWNLIKTLNSQEYATRKLTHKKDEIKRKEFNYSKRKYEWVNNIQLWTYIFLLLLSIYKSQMIYIRNQMYN